MVRCFMYFILSTKTLYRIVARLRVSILKITNSTLFSYLRIVKNSYRRTKETYQMLRIKLN